MKTIYFIVILLLFCAIGQCFINHYIAKALEAHNKSLHSILDMLKMQ